MNSIWIRTQITNRIFTNLRSQISEFIPSNSNVVDVGCSTGQFLIEIADRIESGVGIDHNEKMISFAVKKSNKDKVKNLQFLTTDAIDAIDNIHYKSTVTICSLCLHEMTDTKAIEILNKYFSISKKIIIVDLCEPKSFLLKKLLHLDEWISGHYNRFALYLKNHGIPGLINQSNIKIYEVKQTNTPSIKIWICYNE